MRLSEVTAQEGREARNGDYRELLADKIAQAIVDQRHGPGVYHASATATVVNQEPQPLPQAPPPPAKRQRKPVLAPPGERTWPGAANAERTIEPRIIALGILGL